MSFRTVVVKDRAKLDYQLGYLVCRSERETRVYMNEISTLILESTAISITGALIAELIKGKVKVIFCDETHNPLAELVGYRDYHRSAGQVMRQVRWEQERKERAWQSIIAKKIGAQAEHLRRRGNARAELLESYASNVLPGDPTNREGHAAKVYFNELFGYEGRRCETFYNSALNYGYAILLSVFTRRLTACGCVLQLGIWHSNEFNPFNLASDAMEPFRVIVDELALTMKEGDPEMKRKMQALCCVRVRIGGRIRYLDDAVEVYVRTLLESLEGERESPLHWEEYVLT